MREKSEKRIFSIDLGVERFLFDSLAHFFIAASPIYAPPLELGGNREGLHCVVTWALIIYAPFAKNYSTRSDCWSCCSARRAQMKPST